MFQLLGESTIATHEETVQNINPMSINATFNFALPWAVDSTDRTILLQLAEEYRNMCDEPVNQERRRLWIKHNDLIGERPMILIEKGRKDVEKWLPDGLKCQGELARELEWAIRYPLLCFRHVGDDMVYEPFIRCRWAISRSDYGVKTTIHQADNGGQLGACSWDAPLKDIPADLSKLTKRQFTLDRSGSLAWQAYLQDLFGGILPAVIRPDDYDWSINLTKAVVHLIGLEEMLMAMYDHPQALHQLLEFLTSDQEAYWRWLESEKLPTPNNGNEYTGSGTLGYTSQLPCEDFTSGMSVGLNGLWGFVESQETVGVSPEMFEEFILRYHKRLAAPFGRLYYGCCEPVHDRLPYLETLPNLRSVSISPWCNQDIAASFIKRDYIYSRKPQPSFLCIEKANWQAMEEDLRQTIQAAQGCEIELIMNCVLTLYGESERMPKWVDLARRVCEESR